MSLTLLRPPATFPVGELIEIKEGSSLEEIADELVARQVIGRSWLFTVILRISGGARYVHAGIYRFDEPANLVSVASRLVRGESGIPNIKITFPEGLSVREMNTRITGLFPRVGGAEFLNAAQPYEGYLFPDTYHFFASADTDDLISAMRENFEVKFASQYSTLTSPRTLADIVIMASLLEREANTEEDRRMIAGILWKRIEIDMPLQVDVVFGYILEKGAYAPTFDDLKIDSPYNTYLYRGLPPTPINNPGLAALHAAVNPTLSPYLFYLTGNDGTMRYARTFAEHKQNREKYLK
jgi:UPF0755 protein